MLDLYRKIKQKRLELGLTQEELATLMGYTDRSSIAKIESGKVDLSLPKVEQFADALNVSPSWLMGWTEIQERITEQTKVINEVAKKITDSIKENLPEFEGLTEPVPISDIDEIFLIKDYRALDSEDKRMVNSFIDTLLMKDKYKKDKMEGGEVG